VVDASASMGYARNGVSKLTYAGYLASALAYLLGQQGDPAGLLLFDDQTRHYLPPSTRSGQVREIFRLLETAPPSGKTAADRVFGQVGELADKRSLVIIFSDLLDSEEAGRPTAGATSPDRPGARGPVAERLANLAARGHDVVVFHLLDPDEVELPFEDLMFFEAMEPGDGRTLLAEASELRQAFRDESRAFRERWRRACVEIGVEYRFTATDAPPAEVLRSFLSGRRRGARR
jgi:uncharacterized protein (DUF58 family)